MRVKDKVCVVTGAASGIGEAVARAYAAAGARGAVVADLGNAAPRLAWKKQTMESGIRDEVGACSPARPRCSMSSNNQGRHVLSGRLSLIE
jgi:NAD(P)-dependent dehydrogenase (short-subunit alcohol dehydrogenase family)